MTKDQRILRESNNCLNQTDTKDKRKIKCDMDLAGKIFHLVSTPKIPCVYRFWATMKDKVDRELLQQALENIMPRFPYFQVKVSWGFFWNKWRMVSDVPKVRQELEYPCQYIPIRDRHTFPYRIISNDNQIIIEFNHSLTDGYGSLIFLKALVSEYLVLKGHKVKDWGDTFRPDQKPSVDEVEYSYRENYKLGIPKIPKIYKAFHLQQLRMKKGISIVTNGKVDVKEILKLSKEKKVTLTEFLTAVYIEVLQDIMFELSEKKKRRRGKRRSIRPVRIMLPIDVRKHFKSKTMRNFTAFMFPGIDPRLGRFDFEEIIQQVHYYQSMNMNPKSIQQQISFYTGLAVSPLVGIIPNFLKLMVIKPVYKHMGESLGKASMPEELQDEVIDIQVLPMYHPYFKSGIGLLTFNDILNINFVRNIKENVVEEQFFNKLRELGLKVQVTELFK
ncbi:MAG: hypothetical protein ACTSSH_03765 [Candidatus Heimdallarchaeota archaeon]